MEPAIQILNDSGTNEEKMNIIVNEPLKNFTATKGHAITDSDSEWSPAKAKVDEEVNESVVETVTKDLELNEDHQYNDAQNDTMSDVQKSTIKQPTDDLEDLCKNVDDSIDIKSFNDDINDNQ